MPRTSTPAPFRLAVALLGLFGLFAWSPFLSPARAQAVPPGEGLVADSTELRVLRQFYAWADVPASYECPECGVGKDDFEMIEI